MKKILEITVYAGCKDCHRPMAPWNGCLVPFIRIKGKSHKRIEIGNKQDFHPCVGDAHVCHDCNATNGQYHHFGCDMERCPSCLGQLISCGCVAEIEEN